MKKIIFLVLTFVFTITLYAYDTHAMGIPTSNYFPHLSYLEIETYKDEQVYNIASMMFGSKIVTDDVSPYYDILNNGTLDSVLEILDFEYYSNQTTTDKYYILLNPFIDVLELKDAFDEGVNEITPNWQLYRPSILYDISGQDYSFQFARLSYDTLLYDFTDNNDLVRSGIFEVGGFNVPADDINTRVDVLKFFLSLWAERSIIYYTPLYQAPLDFIGLDILLTDYIVSPSYKNGYNNGYENGKVNGYDEGYKDAYNKFAFEDNNVLSILTAVFSGLAIFLDTPLLAGITIGNIIMVPLIFGIIALIIGGSRGKRDD